MLEGSTKITALVKLPPPNTGATSMNKIASEILSKRFGAKILDVSYHENVQDLGTFNFKKLLRTFGFYLTFLKLLINERPGLIYFQISPFGFAFIRDLVYVSLAKLFGTRILFHLHAKGVDKAAKENRVFKLLYRLAFSNQFIIVLSEKLNSDLKDVYKGRPFVLPNCIRYSDVIHTKAHGHIDFLFLSNLFESKGISIFLESLSVIKASSGRSFKAAIIGQEADWSRDNLGKYLEEHNLSDECDYLGAMYGEEKMKVLSNASVLVFPTLNDVWGLVILEAFSQKTPVIASDDGAISDMVQDGVTGRLLEKGNVDQFAQAMLDSLTMRKEFTDMGVQGFDLYMKKFSEKAFEEKLLEIMQICTLKK